MQPISGADTPRPRRETEEDGTLVYGLTALYGKRMRPDPERQPRRGSPRVWYERRSRALPVLSHVGTWRQIADHFA